MTIDLKKYITMLPMLLLCAMALVSCSETEAEEGEFDNWQSKNDTQFKECYLEAKSQIAGGNTKFKLLKAWSLPDNSIMQSDKPEDYIVVEVIEEGKGSGCPLATDQVLVHYSGRLIPSKSYAAGYVFDQSYYGEYNEKNAIPVSFTVSGTVVGFATALQNMHIGDHWRVTMPYQLGYGSSSSSSSIPDYSNLIFDIRMVAYARPGVEFPNYN